MSARVEAARTEVDGPDASLHALQRELDEAGTQAGPLARQCAEMIPAVPDNLLASAATMGQHNRQMTATTADSMVLARNTHKKIARLLGALQIGDITWQRIEHVQGGLASVDAIDPSVPAEGQQRMRALIRHLLAAELDSTVEDFNPEVTQLSMGLDGLTRDAAALLRVRDLIYGGDDAQEGGFLRNLEQRIGDAVRLVTEIEAADALTRETSRQVAETARVFSGRQGAVQSIKTDVLFMSLNMSLTSARLGEAGRPLATIAVGLRSQAGQLERVANVCGETLKELTGAAVLLEGDGAETAEGAGEGAGLALRTATAHIHEASAATERDIATLATQGESVLALLKKSSQRLDLQRDIGAALAQVLQDLPGEPVVADLCTGDIRAPLGAILDQLRATYTMALERDLHDALAAEWGLDVAAPPAAEPASGDAFEDALF